MMALPEDLDDPRLYRLPLEVRAIFEWAHLFSLAASKIPGRFINQSYDAPMSVEDIADGIHADAAQVESAFARLRATKPEPLMTFERGEWVIPGFERRTVDGEREKVRIANRERQRNYRARKKGDDVERQPTPLREVQ